MRKDNILSNIFNIPSIFARANLSDRFVWPGWLAGLECMGHVYCVQFHASFLKCNGQFYILVSSLNVSIVVMAQLWYGYAGGQKLFKS